MSGEDISFDFIGRPSAQCQVPDAPADPTPEQEEKLQEIISRFADEEYRLPDVVEDEEKDGRLTEAEQMFLSREGCLRNLIASKFDIPATITRIENCLRWRRKTRIDNVQEIADKVENEYARNGGQIHMGYSVRAQPVIIIIPAKRDIPPSENGLLQLFFLLERAIDLMPPTVSRVTFLVDFAGKRKYSTPISFAREWIAVLQEVYCERLGVGMICNIPWLLNAFISAAYMFMDPVTKDKIRLNPPVKSDDPKVPAATSVIPADEMLSEYGGNIKIDFDEEVHKRYWSTLVNKCLERREHNRQNWIKLGGGVGKSEIEWKKMTAEQLGITEPR